MEFRNRRRTAFVLLVLLAARGVAQAEQPDQISCNLLSPNLNWGSSGYDLAVFYWLSAHQQSAQGTIGVVGGQSGAITSYVISGAQYTPQQLGDAIIAIGRTLYVQTIDVGLSGLTENQREVYLFGTAALTLPGAPYVYLPDNTTLVNPNIAPQYQTVVTFTAPTPAVRLSNGAGSNMGLNPDGLVTPPQASVALAQVQKYHADAQLHDSGTDYPPFGTDYGADIRKFWVIDYAGAQGQTLSILVNTVLDLTVKDGGALSKSDMQAYDASLSPAVAAATDPAPVPNNVATTAAVVPTSTPAAATASQPGPQGPGNGGAPAPTEFLDTRHQLGERFAAFQANRLSSH